MTVDVPGPSTDQSITDEDARIGGGVFKTGVHLKSAVTKAGPGQI